MRIVFVASPDEGRWLKLLRRAVRATLLSTFSFYILTFPLPRELSMSFGSLVYRLFDLPISLLNVVLPMQLQSGFASQFIDSTYCFPRSQAYERFRYLAVGIPAWTAVLYLLGAVRVVWPRVRQRTWHGV